MKKLFTIVFLMALTTSVFAQYQYFDFSSECPSGQTLYYTIIDNTTVEVSRPSTNWNGYTQPTGNLIIPETVEYEGNTYTVVSIDQMAFYQCYDITSVEFPNTIVSIQESAFYKTGLTSVVIPDSVTIIKAWAFSHCTDLLSLIIGASVSTIETGAFKDCTNLQTIYCNTPTLPEYANAYNNTYYVGEVFENVPTDIPVYVSCLAFGQFEANAQWDQFVNLQGVYVGTPELEVSCNIIGLGTVEVVAIPEDCDDNYATVKAIPNPGHVFSYWRKGLDMVSFSSEYTFALDQNTSLIACFDSEPIAYDSIAFPEHVIGQKLNIFGEVTYEYPSNFIYNQNGILTNYNFPGFPSCTYHFEEYPSKPSSIEAHYGGHPLWNRFNFTYENNKIKHAEDTWDEIYDNYYYDYYYDDTRHLIQKDYSNDDGCYGRYLYTYENGNRTRIDSYFIVYYSGENRLSTKTTNHYNQRQQILTAQTDTYNSNGEITASTLKTYSYTPHHKTDNVITQNLVDGEWANSGIACYVYDGLDRVIEYQTGSWSAENEDWNITKKVLYNFNDAENKLTVSFKKKNGDEWVWDTYSNQTLFYDSKLYEWQRTFRFYHDYGLNINQFVMDLHYDIIEATFPDQSEWYYEIEWENGDITYQHLEYAADTTIGTSRPKIIIRSNTQYDRDAHTEVTHEYIIEANNKVYWWNKDLEEFTMLYDYLAEEGDEWEIKVGTEAITVHVDSIGLFEYEGETKKILHISDIGNVFNGDIVVGYGHMTSFFPEKLMRHASDFTVNGLRCYWVGDALLYHNGDEDCDAIYSEIHGVEEDGPSTGSGTFTVYPNPTNSVLFVQTVCTTSLPTEQKYRITNLMGQTLLQGTISAETQQIDISGLPAGMYFISVNEQTVKFVKQ